MASVTELDKIHPKTRSRAANARTRADKRITARALFSSEIDGRSSWGRAFRDKVALIVEDCGGLERVSEVKLSLIRRSVALSIEAERLEIELARGNAVDLDLMQRLLGQLRRVAELIGVDKVPSKRPSSIADIAERIAREKAVERDKAHSATPVALASQPRAHAPLREDGGMD